VETDDIAVDVSSPTTYIQSHEDSVAVSTVVSSGDDTVVGSHSSAVFDNIQLSDTDAVNADLVQTSPTSLAVDLTTSSELPTLDAAASRSTYIIPHLVASELFIIQLLFLTSCLIYVFFIS